MGWRSWRLNFAQVVLMAVGIRAFTSFMACLVDGMEVMEIGLLFRPF